MKRKRRLKSLVIITGMSGSGKHTAFKAFEDLGYFCVDNLPTSLVPRLVQMSNLSGGALEKLAIVIDVRLGESVASFEEFFQELKHYPFLSTVLFFDATDEVLARRYSETRRIHPLARQTSLLEGVRAERKKLAGVRALADLVVDTTEITVHELRRLIYEQFQARDTEESLNLSVVSFGFKNGLPHNSDMVFDVRFLPNPNFVEGLKEKTGNDEPVVEYMGKFAETEEFIQKVINLLEYLIPKYRREGKSYLTVSVGCTGGRHRSVMVANELSRRLMGNGQKVNLIHRDLLIQ